MKGGVAVMGGDPKVGVPPSSVGDSVGFDVYSREDLVHSADEKSLGAGAQEFAKMRLMGLKLDKD